jgi:hypothetical protein
LRALVDQAFVESSVGEREDVVQISWAERTRNALSAPVVSPAQAAAVTVFSNYTGVYSHVVESSVGLAAEGFTPTGSYDFGGAGAIWALLTPCCSPAQFYMRPPEERRRSSRRLIPVRRSYCRAEPNISSRSTF